MFSGRLVLGVTLLSLLGGAASAEVFERGADGEYVRTSGSLDVFPVEVLPQARGRTGAQPFAAEFAAAALRYDVSPALLRSVAAQESGFRADAVSKAGAVGVMQLMPTTAAALGVDPADPAANILGGAAYLRQQLDRFDGRIDLALAAYNAGPGRVIRAGGTPAIRETQDYVTRCLERLAVHAEGTANTQPEQKR